MYCPWCYLMLFTSICLSCCCYFSCSTVMNETLNETVDNCILKEKRMMSFLVYAALIFHSYEGHQFTVIYTFLLHNQIFEKYIIQPVWRTRPSFWNLQRITMFRNLNIFLLENFFKKIRNSICAKHGFVTSFFEKNIFFHTSFFYVSKPSSIRVDIVKYIRLRFKSYTLYLFIL